MQRMICDQLVKCVETHNKNVFNRKSNASNNRIMIDCVAMLLKRGRTPILTVKNMGTMKEYQIAITRPNMLSEKLASMPCTKLSFVSKSGGRVEEYAEFGIQNMLTKYCAI